MTLGNLACAGFACAGQGKKSTDKNGKHVCFETHGLEDHVQSSPGAEGRTSVTGTGKFEMIFKFFQERQSHRDPKRVRSLVKGALVDQGLCPEAILGSLEMLWLILWARKFSTLYSCRQALEIVEGCKSLVQQGGLDLEEVGAGCGRPMQTQSLVKGALLDQGSCPEAILGSLEMLWLTSWARKFSTLYGRHQALEIVDGCGFLVWQGCLDLEEAEATFQSACS